MTFRIFTNDRGRKNGTFLYSAFRDIPAKTAADAEEFAAKYWGPFAYRTGEHGPIKAIEWPPETQESKDWLAKHVGSGL